MATNCSRTLSCISLFEYFLLVSPPLNKVPIPKTKTIPTAVGIVLVLGIGTLFKGGETSKKYSNKLMQLRVLLQFVAILVLVAFAYFFKN